jgi:hypothetical protein
VVVTVIESGSPESGNPGETAASVVDSGLVEEGGLERWSTNLGYINLLITAYVALAVYPRIVMLVYLDL